MMSSAAAVTDFRSISSSVQSSKTTADSNSSTSCKLDAGFDCSFSMSSSVPQPSSGFPGRSRRKPRLMKLRKQSGPQIIDPNESSFDRIDPTPKVSSTGTVKGFPNCGSFGRSDNVSFGFCAGKSDSTLNTNLESLSTNKSDVAVNSGAMLNKKNGESFESVEGMGGCRIGKNGNDGFVFGARKNDSGLDSSLENLGFVFGASSTSSPKFNWKSKNGDWTNKSSPASYLSVSNKEPECSESNGNSKSKMEFGQRKSSGNVGQPQGDEVKNCSSESHKNEQSSTLQSDKLNANFVFGASKPNFELENEVCNKDEAYRGPEYQGPKLNGTFVFGCGVKGKIKVNEDGKVAEEMENFSREKILNHNGCWNAPKSDTGCDGKLKFDSSSRNIVDTDFPKPPIYKLSNEMNSLNIGQPAPVNDAEKTNGLNEKSRVNIQNVFVFGFNQSTSNVPTENGACHSCDLPKDVSLKDPVSSSGFDKADTIEGESNAKRACASEIVENFASSLKGGKDKGMPGETVHTNSKFGLSGVQNNSFSFSAGNSGKENMPTNFNSEFVVSSELPQDHPNSDMERDNMPFPLFTTEIFGSRHKVDTPEAPSGHQDEKKEEFSFPSTPFIPGKSFSDFSASNSSKSFSFTADLFSGVNEKLGCGTSSRLRDKKVKKKKSLRQETLVQRVAGQTDLSNGNSSTHNDQSPGCCSPMDFSPYQDTNSSTSADNFTRATETKDDVATNKDTSVFNDSHKKCGEGNEKFSGTDSGKDSNTRRDFSSYTSPSAQDGLSSIRRQYRKKYKLKVDSGSNSVNHRKVEFSTDAVQHSSFGRKTSGDIPSGVTSHMRNKVIHLSKVDEDHGMLGLTDREVCEKWRIRGNQAYKAGNLLQAEDLYTKGIKSVSATEISGSCLEPLLLCYSNRAATRMSLRRMREAISDCASAAALDPHFLKVKLRAANCYLVLGEVEEAIKHYNICLESRINLCLDRRITIEAAEGLQKAQKVSEHLHRCAELLQQRTPDAAKDALGITNEALSISCYSEKLLEMKGEALCKLQMYNEVIELCENSLDIAEKNFTSDFINLNDVDSKSSSLMLWRWLLKSRAHFHLGKLEMALDLIEKQEHLVSVEKRSGNMTQESSSPLAATIRELLHRKKAGNEAFKSGKYMEAIEHYTAAISSSVESRPFAAICFCNRAAAHQALGQIVDAIADCSLAIALDKNYTKAVSRRATLHEMIRDYGHAVNDLERLISLQEAQSQERTRQSEVLDKSNGSSAKEAKRTRRQLSSIQEKAKRATPLDLYLILGIKSSDTESDIKKAYRKAALRHHPDKAGQILARSDALDDGGLWKEISDTVRNDADRLFKLIGEAYAVLSNSDKRAKHDLEEETRDVQRESARNSGSCRPSDTYSSPFERTNWSRRQSNFYSSPFGKSSSRHYGQEYWRTYGESHPRW
ncbi:uncharacterized protein LOC125856681 isoform X1 [Solanum stenotomum]|uniref:uncharacterized protein LOC125856681 isoform X1 n=1 Tax=Solanum stenotomum TaxID=172797 RepID=UPI0020D13406|nr:uncharacterized protein LOC125856681 isoform X1 [Solanum stenotomum]XP_049392240.1 uncharacterized protein LOC125856681 isoform X1 [Solanum stenotomum]